MLETIFDLVRQTDKAHGTSLAHPQHMGTLHTSTAVETGLEATVRARARATCLCLLGQMCSQQALEHKKLLSLRARKTACRWKFLKMLSACPKCVATFWFDGVGWNGSSPLWYTRHQKQFSSCFCNFYKYLSKCTYSNTMRIYQWNQGTQCFCKVG